MLTLNHFKPTEFNCPDGSFNCMSRELLEKLDAAREIAENLAGHPVYFVITSSYRNEAENKEAGGVENSPHMRGTAVDIACSSSRDRYYIVQAALMAGFTRIGIGKTFIHLDTDSVNDPEVIWVY